MGAADVGGKGSRATPEGTSLATKNGTTTEVDDDIVFVIASIPESVVVEPDDDTRPIHRIEPTAGRNVETEIETGESCSHSELTGDRAAAANDDETTKAYAYME